MKIYNALCKKRREYANEIMKYEEKYRMIITPGFEISRNPNPLSEKDVVIGDVDFTDAKFEVIGGQDYTPAE